MSLKRSFLSRRIIHRSFGISKSGRHKSASLNPGSFRGGYGVAGEEENGEEENDGGGSRRGPGDAVSGSWAGMPPELLGEIMERVEAGDENWPQRQNVVACACVCRRWRDAAREAVEKASLNQPGQFRFPSSLKKPGPRDFLFQCLIKRDKKNATFYLYLALSPSPSFTEKGKFLLAARRYRSGAHTEYIISLDSTDLSQGSKAYVGKLRSDFLGTNFTIYDTKPPLVGVKPSNIRRTQISPQIPSGIFQVGHVSYKFNFLKSRGPRRMVSSLTYPSLKKPESLDYTVLNNKAPRWHQHLECWCLNFRGRVTVASVKNFQMVSIDHNGKEDEETVVLQFGKIGADTFTMDFRQPLSAFQAFAICLTSFGTKLACE